MRIHSVGLEGTAALSLAQSFAVVHLELMMWKGGIGIGLQKVQIALYMLHLPPAANKHDPGVTVFLLHSQLLSAVVV